MQAPVTCFTDDRRRVATKFQSRLDRPTYIFGNKIMARITLNTLQCEKKQDLAGKDEPVLYIADQKVWEGKMEKGSSSPVNESRNFGKSVSVELKEKNGNTYTSLSSWTVLVHNRNNETLTASSSGYHYELYCSVAV